MRDLLLLMRAPLAATAAANALVGLLLARSPAAPWTPDALGGAFCLALASCCLYWAGMVLNDLFDLERDRELHPGRPLPAGRVRPATAAGLGGGLLVAGGGLAAAAGALGGGGALRGLVGAGALAACVLAYDGFLKRFRVPGALAMGACRGANALLGPIAFGVWSPVAPLGPGGWALVYAVLLTWYVAALTGVSTLEDEEGSPAQIGLAFGATGAAPVAAGALTLLPGGWSPLGWLGFGLLAGRVVREAGAARAEGTRARGGRMTIALLKGLWLFDLGALLAGLGTGEATRVQLGLGLASLGALFAAGSLARRALFGPPPGPTAGPTSGGGQGAPPLS